jgi:hypothetical protein
MMSQSTKKDATQPGHADARKGKDRDAKRHEADEQRRKKFEAALDQGLEDTFPASDPVAVTQPPHSPRDKHKP